MTTFRHGTQVARDSLFPCDAFGAAPDERTREVRPPSTRSFARVALRTFIDRDGQAWQVWKVQPSTDGRALRPDFRVGWLCFERLKGGDRCRLAGSEVPTNWEELPDERLDLLRRICDPGTPARGIVAIEHESEADQRP